MVLPDIITSAYLLSLGGVIVGAGLLRLSRQDQARVEFHRQSACRWHQWQVLEEGTSLVCALCGKTSRRIRSSTDPDPERIPSENIFL